MQKKIYGLSFIFLIVDQIIKFIISKSIKLDTNIEIINNFLSIAHVHNDGAAFSILSGNVIFLIITTIIAMFLIYLFFIKDKKMSIIECVLMSMLYGGIIGNFIDRILYGYVIDYIEVKIINYNFPIFNFADICIVLGVIGIMILGFREELCKNSKLKKKVAE